MTALSHRLLWLTERSSLCAFTRLPASVVRSDSKVLRTRLAYCCSALSGTISLVRGLPRVPLLCSSVPSRLKTGYRKKADVKESDETDEESDCESADGDDSGLSFDDSQYAVAGCPMNFKIVKHHLGSLRSDAVLAAGLNISRRKVEDEFLNSKLQVNGEKLLRKSVQVKAGDVIDLVVESTEDGTMKVKRVKVLRVDENRTAAGRSAVLLQAWRTAFSRNGS